jgi:hypothetical protein
MKQRLVFVSPLMVAFLAAATTATASNTWYANGVSGNNKNNCKSPQTACKTIGHAVSLASSGDSIMVAAATYRENLIIGKSLTILGSGHTTTIIDGGSVATGVTVSISSVHVTLTQFTIRNGFATNGAGVNNSGTLTISDSTITGNVAWSFTTFARGGGVYNQGTLTINNSVVANNRADTDAGGIFNTSAMAIKNSTISKNSAMGDGGGMWNLGTLTIDDSTISDNTAGAGLFSTGGGIANSATMIINNSTIAGNHEIRYGVGGIVNLEGTLTMNNTTTSGNEGGIYVNLGTTTLQNSIVANNSDNCYGTITSNGYNLSSDDTCNFSGPGDMNNTDPMLGPLQNNGGPTQTIAELEGSLTIDAGNPSGCTDGQGHLLKTDQRGFPRPGKDKHDHRCDMGAYESQTD